MSKEEKPSKIRKAPAILLFKNMKSGISRLTDADRLALFDAILQYADEDSVPEMNYAVSIIFDIIKSNMDINEKKYNDKCEYNANRSKLQREKSKSKPPDEDESEEKVEGRSREPTAKDKPSGEVEQGKVTEIQARFLNAFKECCPNQAINCTISDFPDVDLNALMLAIQRSPQYLMNAEKNQNLGGLRWYLENATKIIAGKYEKFSDDIKKLSNRHNYSREEYNSVFQNPDEIEI